MKTNDEYMTAYLLTLFVKGQNHSVRLQDAINYAMQNYIDSNCAAANRYVNNGKMTSAEKGLAWASSNADKMGYTIAYDRGYHALTDLGVQQLQAAAHASGYTMLTGTALQHLQRVTGGAAQSMQHESMQYESMQREPKTGWDKYGEVPKADILNIVSIFAALLMLAYILISWIVHFFNNTTGTGMVINLMSPLMYTMVGAGIAWAVLKKEKPFISKICGRAALIAIGSNILIYLLFH